MACESCGEKPKNHSKDFTKAVVEINNPEKLVLLRKVMVPASMGDDTEFLPEIGKFYNVILQYEANSHIYIYSSDGIPTKIDASVSQEILDKIAELEEDLATETGLRQAGDDALQADIDSAQNSLDAEITAREEADTTLAGDILAERTARTNADTALQAAISAEQTARQTADANLQGQIDSIEEVIPAQASASNQLADKNFVNSSVATNTANYISNNGQPFNSLAELEAYSGPLTNNDYAFVTGTDAQGNTFYDRYKYNANTGEWAFEYELNNSSFTANQWATINSGITSGDVTKLQGLANIQTIGANLTLTNGELSATDTTYTAGSGLALNGTQFSVDTTAIATQSDLTAGLATKQDTLTAGANIQINNNTISATDTTYSDFVGTDGTVAGSAGLVPAPATTDAGKFLKADGTWDEAGSPINVVQTTGTSTTDVMSQNATTSMVFADPAARKQIQIGNGATNTSVSGVAIGEGSRVNAAGLTGIAIGSGATAGSQCVSIGKSAGWWVAGGTISIGNSAIPSNSADNGIAIGGYSYNGGAYSIALGAYSKTSAQGQMDISTSYTNNTYGYNNSQYRLLTGLYDPQTDHDAATKGYVDTAVASAGANEISLQDWSALWQ